MKTDHSSDTVETGQDIKPDIDHKLMLHNDSLGKSFHKVKKSDSSLKPKNAHRLVLKSRKLILIQCISQYPIHIIIIILIL
jgi:hypothetical protein